MQRLKPEELKENVSTVGDFSVSPNGLNVAFSSQTARDSQIFISSIDYFYPEQITFDSGFKKMPLWSPDGSKIAFVKDQDGDEHYNIFTVSLKSRAIRQVTKLPASFFRGYAWSPEGNRIAFSANHEGPHSIFTIREDGEELERLTSASRFDIRPCWAPDSSCVVYTKWEDGQELSFVEAVDMNGTKRLCAASEKVSYSAENWIITGIRIAGYSDEPGSRNLGLLDVATGNIHWTAEADNEKYRVWSPDGKYAACVINKDRNRQMAILETESGTQKTIGPASGLSASPEFTCDCSSLLFTHEGPQNPSELFVYHLASGVLSKLTNGLPENIDSEQFVIPKEIYYSSSDGLEIPALLYRPACTDPSKMPPAVLRIHGGPSYQSFNKWDPTIQLLLNHGFIVLAPNFRGSTGYGNEFTELSKNDWGGGDLKDVIAAADFLEKEGIADGDRIGIYGGSYGGYLMLLAMAKAPDRWASGVCLYGFTDLEEFYRSIPDWMQTWMKSEIGTPEDKPQFYKERSPVTWCSEIKAPLLFLQGANDARVPLNLALSLKSKMEEYGSTFSLKIYEDEGHGFQKKANQIDADGIMLDFFIRYCLEKKKTIKEDQVHNNRIELT